jgi:isopentenyl phosphate kinase
MPTEKERAEAIIKIGGGLIEEKHLEKWIKRLKIKKNMDILRNLFVEH